MWKLFSVHMFHENISHKFATLRPAHRRFIWTMEQSILEEKCRSMGQQWVTLHFSKSDSTASSPAFHWLMGQYINGSCAAYLKNGNCQITFYINNLQPSQLYVCEQGSKMEVLTTPNKFSFTNIIIRCNDIWNVAQSFWYKTKDKFSLENYNRYYSPWMIIFLTNNYPHNMHISK